ncbi:hypothetical protein C882_2796 [Caenispirillum salinarum AK4]|uniref:Uncharacterized protein n=1 Tax=Caenispirillum salinarum AK4 TaxID=1238182 RepID=K9HC51_9PROT|nr:hypothetical protein [Caenispirillum salinarum]EKV26361.1 hypothetical protein C882_2796 [Caenispirillum salinarum AK4]
MDDDVLRAALDAIAEKRASDVHPAVLKELQDAGLAHPEQEPATLTDAGEEKRRQLGGG